MDLSIIILVILISFFIIGLVIWASISAYKAGAESGNTTTSIILILFGIFIGFTFIPGLCHLAGTSKHNQGISFDKAHKEHRDLENEKLRAEIAYYKSMINKSETQTSRNNQNEVNKSAKTPHKVYSVDVESD